MQFNGRAKARECHLTNLVSSDTCTNPKDIGFCCRRLLQRLLPLVWLQEAPMESEVQR